MASDFDVDASSEEENLSVVKREADENIQLNDKKIKYRDSSDEETGISEVLVRVEVEEMDESDTPLDYSMREDPLASTSKAKKRTRKRPCPQCEEVFETTSELREHAIKHQVETRHKCENCGRCFNRAYSLRLHMKVHEYRELKCPLCELTFTKKIDLGRHLMSHERLEECSKCHAKFHTREQLESHLRSHDDTVKRRLRVKQKRKPNSGMESKGQKNEMKKVKTEVITEENRKREDFNYYTQCAIVSKMQKGRPIEDICRLYNVTTETVNEIWEDRDKYDIPTKNGKNLNNVLDNRILEWLNNQRASDNQVTGQMLQDKAEDIAKEIGFVTFNGSKKWLDRFKARYKITLRTQPVKRDSPSAAFDSKWKKAFFKEQWCDARVGFTDDNIYTADEVGLYYNPSKGRIKKQPGKKFIHGHVKDRLSILMCTNVSGTDKKKLLVCAVDDPLKHSHRDVETLPVTYIRHSQAHFTTKMFEDYVTNWNRELERFDKKALLVLDRATIHTKMQLSNLKLCYVPWKASVGLMPIKNGIFAKFRDEFRRLLLEEKAINVLKGIDRNIACMEVLYMLEKAWERVPPDVIMNSFQTTGYDIVLKDTKPVIITPKVKGNDEEDICQMLKDFDVESYYTDLSHLDMYLTVDEELVTGQGTNCSVFGGNHKVDTLAGGKETEDTLPVSTGLPETSERERAIKRNRAMEDLEIVRKYLMKNDSSYELYCHFMEVEKFLYKNPVNFES